MATDDRAWPEAFIDWSRDITTEEVDRLTLWRFQNYPFLWDNPTPNCRRIAGFISQVGRERAFKMAAEDLCRIPGYFLALVEYKRWLLTVAYREALRLLPLFPDVSEVFHSLGDAHAQVLRYLYFDQFTDGQLVTALGLARLPSPHPGVTAYPSLCDRLGELGWSKDNQRPFPAYPNYSVPLARQGQP